MRSIVASIFLLIGQSTGQINKQGPALDLASLYPDSNIFIPNRAEWQIIAYKGRIKDFRKDKIVFLGNSITEGGKDWNKMFGLNNIVNRGITGDITESMLARLNEIYYYKPIKVFLLIGLNDVFDGVVPYKQDITPERIVNNIYQIASNIKTYSQGTEIYIQTLLPINEPQFRSVRGFYPKHSTPLEIQINDINRKIIEKNDDNGYKVIDLYSLFVDNDGRMKEELSKDGVHLNDEGYKVWANHVEKFVKLNKANID